MFFLVCLFLACAAARPSPLSPSPPWRQSLTEAWLSPSSPRALIVSHGGDWDLSDPYSSMGAMQRAFSAKSDAVKGDFRSSGDGGAVVVHSSPFEWYESEDCKGKRCEKMTAAEVTECHMYFTKWQFMNVSTLLSYTRDKMITMFDVKLVSDLQHAIDSVLSNEAANRTFLEVRTGDLVAALPRLLRWQSVFFVSSCDSDADVATLVSLSSSLLPSVFAAELSPRFLPLANLSHTVPLLHSHGYRSFAATRTFPPPSAADHAALFHAGIDIVYSYDTSCGVAARTAVDQERGVSPPAAAPTEGRSQ